MTTTTSEVTRTPTNRGPASTTTRRALVGVGATALLGLALAGPATADPLVPGHPYPDQDVPAPAGPPSYNSWPHADTGGAPGGGTGPTNLPAGDSTSYLQVALGALGGLALGAGVAVVAVTGRQRRHHPAHV